MRTCTDCKHENRFGHGKQNLYYRDLQLKKNGLRTTKATCSTGSSSNKGEGAGSSTFLSIADANLNKASIYVNSVPIIGADVHVLRIRNGHGSVCIVFVTRIDMLTALAVTSTNTVLSSLSLEVSRVLLSIDSILELG